MKSIKKSMTPKVSIITPSIRKEGLDLIRESLLQQTFTDWEWIVCSPFEVEDAIWVKDTFNTGFWGLNRAYNALFEKATGDIIISWQDWIWLPPDALQKMVDAVESTGGVVSGVGDQYQRLNEDTGKPEVKIWSDPRKNLNHGSFYECNTDDIEWNFAGFPRKAVFDVGGMDEHLDFLGYGGDQLQTMERIYEFGYKTFIDQTNESFTLRHDRSNFGGQENWDKNHVILNGIYEKRKNELRSLGQWPVVPYLSGK